jgi:hypothetical protein
MSRRHVLRAYALASAVAVSPACTGTVGPGEPGDDPPAGMVPGRAPGAMNGPARPPAGEGPTGGSPAPAPGAAAPAPGTSKAGIRPVHRLTRAEYRNTIRDLALVSDVDAVIKDLPGDTMALFGYELATEVSNLEVDRYSGVAAEIARQATEPARLKALVPCDPAAGDEACARGFITRFGRRAYRRPLETEEVTQLTAFYAKARGDLRYGFADGIRMVLQVMLQSPNFLYRWEATGRPAVKDGLVKLGPHEIASRLSYFLWSSMPDDALFAAADAGKLGTPEEIAAQADRMVASDKFRDTLHRFHDQWLELESLPSAQKAPHLAPNFPALAASMLKENARFVDHVFSEEGGRLQALLTAPYSFVDEGLAKLYGVPGVTGAELRKADLPAGQRLGVLTQGAFLAAHAPPDGTSPVRRGKTILERLLCTPPPPPPDGLEVEPPIPDPTKQTREQFEIHAAGVCRACHVQMDNLGFAFEGYDSVGRWRTMEAGRPLNTRVTVPNLDGKDRDLGGAVDLARVLAGSAQVRACLVTQWARFALGRLEADEEQASLDETVRALQASGDDLRQLTVALARSKAFSHRTPFSWEVQ